jgi:hypothetical protein
MKISAIIIIFLIICLGVLGRHTWHTFMVAFGNDVTYLFTGTK